MARVHIQTVGCRLNQAESERIARAFKLAGHDLVDSESEADLKVVNSCTVTTSAGADSRRAARRNHDDQRVVVTGCHSEVAPDDFSAADEVVLNADKENLAALVMERFGMEGIALGMDQHGAEKQVFPLALKSTRAFVKIQDGCDLSCSFCLTTLARGPSRSRPAEAIVDEVARLSRDGCVEVVLTGVHAGSYGLDLDQDLAWLVDEILSRTDIPRLRLSSLEPWNFRPHWMALWETYRGRLCRHLHMSLQSGCDRILPLMRRGYDVASFAEKLAVTRETVPDMAHTTDIIVGFPGETEADHEESLAFVASCRFSGAHVFTYSPRPGTAAAAMRQTVDADTKRRRAREMRAVISAGEKEFHEAALGAPFLVLWEDNVRDGFRTGLTDHYIKVHAPEQAVQANTLQRVLLDHRDAQGRVMVAPV